MSTESSRSYVPAAGKDWRLPLYDLIAKALGADGPRRLLVEQAAPRPGERVLDLGTGTGALALGLKRAQSSAEVAGLDPDPRALELARGKARRASLEIAFDPGFGDALPYPDASFHLVTSSLMFHHLPRGERLTTLREVLRVLKPGGRFHMVDFDGPALFHGGIHAFIARRVHAQGESAADRVLALMSEAGFADARVITRTRTWAAQMAYYGGRKLGE